MEGRGPNDARGAHVVIRPEDLKGAARLLTRVSDPRGPARPPPRVAGPRAAVCLAASWMLRADVAELWEPGPDGPVLAATTEEGRFSRSAPAIAARVIEEGRTPGARSGDGAGGPVLVEPVQRGRKTV